MLRINKILHPSDFSDAAAAAFDYAIGMALQFNAELHVLHVIAQPSSAVTQEIGLPEDYRRRMEEAARGRLSKMTSKMEGEALPMVYASAVGEVHHKIIGYAQEHGVDIIIMGTNGYTGVKHLVLGSVAEKVVRKSGRPVLTVPLGSEADLS